MLLLIPSLSRARAYVVVFVLGALLFYWLFHTLMRKTSVFFLEIWEVREALDLLSTAPLVVEISAWRRPGGGAWCRRLGFRLLSHWLI